MTDEPELTKYTVLLTPRAVAALKHARETTELRDVDSINRALILYGELIKVALDPRGGQVDVDLFGDDRTVKLLVM